MNIKALTNRTTKLITGLVMAVALSGTAYAGPILGSLSYGGAFIPASGPLGGGGSPVGLAVADYLEFAPFAGDTVGTGDLGVLTAFPSFGDAPSLALHSFAIDPFSAPSPVWTATGPSGFAFALTSMVILEQNSEFLKLTGSGVFTGTGFDPTDGFWNLTAQDTTGGGAPILTFSASSVVPEPGVLTLLGFSLIGLGLIRKVRIRPTTA